MTHRSNGSAIGIQLSAKRSFLPTPCTTGTGANRWPGYAYLHQTAIVFVPAGKDQAWKVNAKVSCWLLDRLTPGIYRDT